MYSMAPSSKTRSPSLKLTVMLLAVLAKLLGYLALESQIHSHELVEPQYTYLENDYPRAWPITTGGTVKMPFEDSVRFNFEEGLLGEALWSTQVPGNGIIYLGENKRPFSLGMFHEIRCVAHLRAETILGRELRQRNATYTWSRLTTHCLNYLRQMALCRADIDLEPVSILPPTVHEYEYRCNNWSSVYEAVERNQEAYNKASKSIEYSSITRN